MNSCQNNNRSVAAVKLLRELATAELGLAGEVCPDRNGHEEPHSEPCWLAGPDGTESEWAQTNPASSFTTGKVRRASDLKKSSNV